MQILNDKQDSLTPHKHKLDSQMCLAMPRLFWLVTQTEIIMLAQQTFNHYLLYRINTQRIKQNILPKTLAAGSIAHC